MILLIDADLVAYRCSASVEPHGEEEIALLRCDRLIQELLHNTQSDQYRCFLTGPNNFRKKINTQYKANRKDTVPPRFLQQCREFLVREWNAEISDGCEADDLLGITQDKENYSTKIASLDKDLLMIPGRHFNWLHNEDSYTVPEDGIRTFYKQMLIGDRSDNIFGVDGIGKVKAAKIIDPLETEEEMISKVLALYHGDVNRFLMNAQCLWILQEEGVTWAHRAKELISDDQLKLEVDLMLSSMKFSMGDISMEPTTSNQKMFGIPVVGELTESMEPKSLPLI